MVNFILIAVFAIALTIGIVWIIDKFLPAKLKGLVTLALWGLIAFLAYITFNSVYAEIEFNQIKKERYADAIYKLIDIRDAELAHKQVKGEFTKSYDSLIKFIENDKFIITQRRDSSVVDAELTRRYGGVTSYKDIIIIDTLGYASVKDSLFKNSTRYKTMMNVPHAKPGTVFKLDAGFLVSEKSKIPVFEAIIEKAAILHDQPSDLISKENEVISVEAINGDALRVGSMEEVKTIGNWPKTYGGKK